MNKSCSSSSSCIDDVVENGDLIPKGTNITRHSKIPLLVGIITTEKTKCHYFLKLRSFQKKSNLPRFTILVNKRTSLSVSPTFCQDIVKPDTDVPLTRADELIPATYSKKHGVWKLSIPAENFKLYITEFYNPMKQYVDEFTFKS
jgi:hypothetical protein